MPQSANLNQPLTSKKFNSDEVQQILVWIAEFKKNEEIFDLVKERFKKTISVTGLAHYKNSEKWQPLIRKHREAWGREIFNIELSHKRKRLEELSEIYHTVKDTGNYKVALDALEKIKNETEKELGNLHLYNIRIYKSMSDEELESERLKTLEEIKKLKELTHASQIGSAEETNGISLSQSLESLSEEQRGSFDVPKRDA